MERKTLLFFNGVAVATTMLASVARADDSGRHAGATSSSPSSHSDSYGGSSAHKTPSIAPSTTSQDATSGATSSSVTPSPMTTPSSVTTTTAVMKSTPAPGAGRVGTTSLTSSDAAIIGPTSTETSRDSVTVYRKTRPNAPMLVTGSVLLAGTYVPTAIVAGQSDRQADKNLYIPVVGPWLNLADRQCSGCDNETRNVALVIGSGILQGVGAGLAIASFLVPQKIEAATIQAGNVKMHVLPTQMGRGGAGVGAVGTF